MRTVRKIITLCIGTMIAAYGIDLAIHAGFGSATLAVLWQGVAGVIGITIGQASFLIAALMVIISFFLDKKQISWGTLIYQVIYSLFVDIFEPLTFNTEYPVVNFFIMLLGVCVFALGAAVYSYADFGRGSYEALTFSIVTRTKWQIKYVRMALDITCVILGLLLGGKVGLCTAATILLSGLLLQFYLTRLNKADPMRIRQKV